MTWYFSFIDSSNETFFSVAKWIVFRSFFFFVVTNGVQNNIYIYLKTNTQYITFFLQIVELNGTVAIRKPWTKVENDLRDLTFWHENFIYGLDFSMLHLLGSWKNDRFYIKKTFRFGPAVEVLGPENVLRLDIKAS